MIIEHCRRHAEDWGNEEQAMRSMRARLMAYSKNFPEAKALREKFQHVSSIAEIEEIAQTHQGATVSKRPSGSGLPTANVLQHEAIEIHSASIDLYS